MKQNKQKFLWFIVLFVVLFLPLQQAQAGGIGDVIANAFVNAITGFIDIVNIPVALGLMVVQTITGILPVIMAEIFKVVVALNNTIALTPASPEVSPTDMVVVGFNFTKDLANMFFILILAWVGFATILRLKSYEVKSIIPKLVIIALLINFIPVICGVILDIANILTEYFADQSTDIGTLMIRKLPGYEIVTGGTSNLSKIVPGTGGISGMAVKSLMGIAFNLIAFFMLGLYTLLLIMRIVAIWILIVLAPLVWLGYIIPAGKKWWSWWWKQFIQWAIIGVFLTFFLYLSGFVLGKSMQCNIDEGAIIAEYGFGTGVLAGITGGLLCSTLPFLAGIIVMLIGFLLSISFAPGGADVVMKSAKKGGMAAGKAAGTAFAKGPLKSYGKGLGKALSFPGKTGFKSVKDSWKELRATKSLGAAVQKGWTTTRTETGKAAGGLKAGAMGLKDWTKIKAGAGAAKDGILKAVKDSATAGLVAGGLKKKKPKASKRCIGGPPGGPPVGTMAPHFIDDGENPCHICGHIFP